MFLFRLCGCSLCVLNFHQLFSPMNSIYAVRVCAGEQNCPLKMTSRGPIGLGLFFSNYLHRFGVVLAVDRLGILRGRVRGTYLACVGWEDEFLESFPLLRLTPLWCCVSFLLFASERWAVEGRSIDVGAFSSGGRTVTAVLFLWVIGAIGNGILFCCVRVTVAVLLGLRIFSPFFW